MKSTITLVVEIDHERNIGSAKEIAARVQAAIAEDLTKPIRLSTGVVRKRMSAEVSVAVRSAAVAVDANESPLPLAEKQPKQVWDY